MRKKLLSAISIISGVLAIVLGLIVLQHYQPQKAAPVEAIALPSDPFMQIDLPITEKVVLANARPTVESTGRTISREYFNQPRPTPTPTIPWMEFNKLSILNQPTVMTIQPGCGDEAFASPQFQILPWTPDIFESGEFDIGKRTAVAWEHLGYTGLWIHSGMDWAGNPLAAQPLQNYLEKENAWTRRSPEEFDQNAAECVIGSTVSFQLGEEILEGKVSAVLRIPAGDVETVSTHVMDLVPYLAKTYPESGFEKLEAPELLLYFCGRLLAGEKPDYSIPDYSRTRIIVAIDFDS